MPRRDLTVCVLLTSSGLTTRSPIRHRLLTILVLGAFVSALSVAALARLLSVSTQHRIDRAREQVLEQLERLARSSSALNETAPGNVVGMRAGFARDAHAPAPNGIPTTWANALAKVLAENTSADAPRATKADLVNSTLVIGTAPAPGRGTAWAALEVRPLPQLEAWKPTIWLLAIATIILVLTTARAVAAMQRDANALGVSLGELAHDLDAPIPRPALHELANVAAGIETLARNLAQARREEARLAKELAQNERLAALGRVAAGVAHEVRNPLASIKLRLDLAVASTQLPEAANQAIAHATSEIVRLDRLVADLLVVSGRSTGPQRPLSLAELARQRVEALEPWAHDRGVVLESQGDAEVKANADSLGRALDNLLRNAVEASPAQGVVTLEIDRDAARARLTVRDQGAGVEASRVTELFEPFFSTKPDGTGLGLPLARSIARAHGGDVNYVRAENGTRFELELPLYSDATRDKLASDAPTRQPEASTGPSQAVAERAAEIRG
jgi:signal transduction histidine kinase